MYWNRLSDKICISFKYFFLQNFAWIHKIIINLIHVLSCVIHATGFCNSFKRNNISVTVAKRSKASGGNRGVAGSITGGYIFFIFEFFTFFPFFQLGGANAIEIKHENLLVVYFVIDRSYDWDTKPMHIHVYITAYGDMPGLVQCTEGISKTGIRQKRLISSLRKCYAR